jgi:hypothetical protein
MALKNRRQLLAIARITCNHRDIPRKARERVRIGRSVQTDNLFSVLEQTPDNVRSDEPRPTRYEETHF